MRSLLVVVTLVACGSPTRTNLAQDAQSRADTAIDSHVPRIDARAYDAPPPIDAHFGDAHIPDAPPGQCSLLAQTGCAAGQKCAWIEDTGTTGHIGCAPDGSVAIGGACTYGQPPSGWDDCKAGAACQNSVCKTICDPSGVSPLCDSAHACEVYAGFLGSVGQEQGGVCNTVCDPLADNFFGKTTRPGTACLANEGCYGYYDQSARTVFACNRTPAGSTMLYHRSACTTANGCASSAGEPYINGCASGYAPYYKDDTGSNTFVCLAACEPADCYSGHCGTNGAAKIGAAPHRCSGSDAAGTFDTAADGDQCVYGWLFEQGSSGTVMKSPYSDKTGVCIDHSLYHLADVTGTTTSTTPWPACDTLPLTTTATRCDGGGNGSAADTSGCTAVMFGCVSTTTGNVTTMHKLPPLRPPYHRVTGS